MNSIQQIFANDGISLYDINCEGTHALGIAISIPDTDRAILQIRCTHGLLLCKIFDSKVIDTLKIPVAIFSAPKFEDMLNNTPIYLSEDAKNIGATEKMTGAQIVSIVFGH